MRVAPGDDTARARDVLAAHLTANAPWGAHVTVQPGATAAPFTGHSWENWRDRLGNGVVMDPPRCRRAASPRPRSAPSGPEHRGPFGRFFYRTALVHVSQLADCGGEQ